MQYRGLILQPFARPASAAAETYLAADFRAGALVPAQLQ